MNMTSFEKKKGLFVLLISFGIGFLISLFAGDQYLPLVLAQRTHIPHCNCTAVKSTVLMNVITDNFLLGNFSTGTGSTVALNTINVKPNESLGIQLSGKIPESARAEIIKASVNENGTMKDVKPAEKIHDYELQYDKATKKLISGGNDLAVNLHEPGYYLVVISLSFGSHHGNNIDKTGGLTSVYETILKLD